MSIVNKYIKAIFPPQIISVLRKIIITPQQRTLETFYKTGKRFAPVLQEFPPMVMIDTTTRCNLACSHCPHSILAKDKKWIADMDVSLYRKIIDEIAKESSKTLVRPFDGGEPLMRKDIHELINYAKQRGIENVYINTNGHLMTEKRAKEIILSGLDGIEFSIDAYSKETYQLIRKSNNYERLIRNIEGFIKLRDNYNPRLTISVSFVKQKDNLHEEELFKKYWKKRVNIISIREYHQHNNLVDEHGIYKERGCRYRHPCPYLWNRIIVQHDGTVRFCESDWKAEHKVGDVSKDTLKTIWHNKVYQELRNSHIAGSFDHPFCKCCTDWKVIRW